MVAAGLRAAAQEVMSARERRNLLKVSELIEQNQAVETAVNGARQLPPDLRQIVLAGARTGRLPYLLEEYLVTYRHNRSLWKSLHLGVLYPVFVVCFSLFIISAFMIVAVPQFKEIFSDFGVELPVITYLMIQFADVLVFIWKPTLLVFLILLGLIWFRSLLPFAALRARLFQAIPGIGTARKMAACSEFCSRLATLVECRLPLDEALMIVSETVRDPFMSKSSLQLARRAESGESGTELAEYNPGLPNALTNAFRWANEPESFAEGLRSLAIVFRSQARISTGQLVMITEPVAFVGVAVTVGFVVISMFMPLIKLLNELS